MEASDSKKGMKDSIQKHGEWIYFYRIQYVTHISLFNPLNNSE